MDTHTPRPDDLNDLELRLTAWQPSAAGLDADALLFAAGRASVRPGAGRFAWPAVAACLALTTVSLGVWLRVERSERLALARLVQPSVPTLAVAPTPPVPVTPPAEPLSPNGYLTVRRRAESDLDTWLARSAPPTEPPAAPPDFRTVLRSGWRGESLGP
jgi:hypothetical protein